MRKQVIIILTMFIVCFYMHSTANAKTAENTNPFEYETVSENENTCCITGIRITKDEGISELKIPDIIDGKMVVSIGKGVVLNSGEEQEWNAFLMYEAADEFAWYSREGTEGQLQRAKKIKKIILPDTIKEIREYAFSGLRGLKSIELPESLTTIGRNAFSYTSIRKMHFPSNLTSIGEGLFYYRSCLEDINIPAKLKDGVAELARAVSRSTVPWKSFTVSKKNPYYKVKKGLLLSKDGKTLYAAVTPKKNIRIPDSVKTIDEYAFWKLSLKSVYLGARVQEIQLHALRTETKCKITLSPKNPYLKKSGMCIYHKKKRNLLVAIPKVAKLKKEKSYILRIPRKVKKLGKTISIVGGKYRIKKLYYPKSIKKMPLSGTWSIRNRGLIIDERCKYIKY